MTLYEKSGEFGEAPVVMSNEVIPSLATESFSSVESVETEAVRLNNNRLKSARHLFVQGDDDIVRTFGKPEQVNPEQYRYDTLVRTTGNPSPTIQTSSRLFGNSNVGDLSRTNLQVNNNCPLY